MNWVFAPSLFFLVFGLSLLFRPDHLHAWDALQLALGLEHYDMAMHQPHPPGYLAPMVTAYLLNALGLSPDLAIEAQSILFAALSAASLFFLGRKLAGFEEAVVAALFFAIHPVTLFYAVSGEVYPCEALFAILLVLAGLKVETNSSLMAKALFFFFYGLSGGVRQSLPLFFAPFVLWRFFSLSRSGFAQLVLLALPASLLGFLAWFLPLVFLSGGLGSLLEHFDTQFFGLFGSHYSALMGASKAAVLAQLDLLFRYSIEAFSVSGLVSLPFLAIRGFRPLLARPLSLVFLFWVVPPYLWFVFMFIAKSGHLLFIIPVFVLIFSIGIKSAIGSPILRRFLVGAAILAQIALFLSPPVAWVKLAGGRSLVAIEHSETLLVETIGAIRRLARNQPDRVLVVTRDARFSFREAMYYLPEVRVWWLMDSESTGARREGGQVCEALNHKVRCSAGTFWAPWPKQLKVVFPSEVRYVVWFYGEAGVFGKELRRLVPVETVKVGGLANLEMTDLWATNVSRFRIGPYLFSRL